MAAGGGSCSFTVVFSFFFFFIFHLPLEGNCCWNVTVEGLFKGEMSKMFRYFGVVSSESSGAWDQGTSKRGKIGFLPQTLVCQRARFKMAGGVPLIVDKTSACPPKWKRLDLRVRKKKDGSRVRRRRREERPGGKALTGPDMAEKLNLHRLPRPQAAGEEGLLISSSNWGRRGVN